MYQPLFKVYENRVPREADLVCYWFVKAGEHVRSMTIQSSGPSRDQFHTGGANRLALEIAIDGGPIFNAWSDEPWMVDGADVRVSLVCFSRLENDFTAERKA